MKSFIVFIIVAFSLLIVSCDQKSNNDHLSKLEDDMHKQKNELEQVKQQLFETNSNLFAISIEEVSKKIATFTPDAKEFQSIETSVGIFFVKLVDIQQYGNGYKVIISIGNPNNAAFSNIDVTVTFGRSNKNNNRLDLSSSHQYNTTITGDLLPGYWNNESIILAPAEKEDIENIWINIKPNETKLKTIPNTNN